MYTDYLWFHNLGLAGVWKGIVGAKIILTVIFFLLFFVLMYCNLYIADQLAPPFRPPGPEEELRERYHMIVGHRSGQVRTAIAALFALLAVTGVSGQWHSWLLFTHSQKFGQTDAQFGRDIGFYVFRLPFLSYVVSWFFASVFVIIIVTTTMHFLNGGIRSRAGAGVERLTPQVKVHLSALLGILALIKAGDYWLARYRLTCSTRGFVNGASYTDVKAQLPASNLLIIISLFSFALLIFNIWRSGWVFPMVTVGLWALVAIVVGTIYPAFMQRFSVETAESRQRAHYIGRNIRATRDAFGLVPGHDIKVEPFDYSSDISASDIRDNAEVLANARIVDPAEMLETFKSLQSINRIYGFPALDVDQYLVDGKPTQVVIGARVLDLGGERSFERKHVTYTHGYGVAIAYATKVNDLGLPEFLVEGVPPEIDAKFVDGMKTPQIYFGEQQRATPSCSRIATKLTCPMMRDRTRRHGMPGPAAWKWALGSGGQCSHCASARSIRSSRATSPETRASSMSETLPSACAKVAPFISWDSDPYPILSNDRIVYVIDGYTTSNHYPNAQRADITGMPQGSGLRDRFNYVRNSVKATVDAYDGTITIYKYGDDPLLDAYEDAFPKLFAPKSEIPPDIEAHFRYPLDLLRVQSAMWAKYHVDDPDAFHSALRWWTIASEPGRSVPKDSPSNGATGNAPAQPEPPKGLVNPYYAQLRLPGEEQLSYVGVRTFVPVAQEADANGVAGSSGQRQNLTALMIARNDQRAPIKLQVYQLPGDNPPAGPTLAHSRMTSVAEVSKEISLLNVEGSTVRYGDLLTLPIDNSLLYVLPLYVTTGDESSDSSATKLPALQRVIVAYGPNVDRVAIGDSLSSALERLFGQSFADIFGDGTSPANPTNPTNPPTTSTPPTNTALTAEVRSLIDQITKQYAAADVALRAGNAVLYAQIQDQIRTLFEQLRKASG